MHFICDWAGFYCLRGLRVFRLCLRLVEGKKKKTETKAGVSGQSWSHTHTQGTFLWTILKRKMKNSTWRICLNTCAPLPFSLFLIFFPPSFFLRLHNCALERWMAACPPAASLHWSAPSAEAQQQHTRTHGGQPGPLKASAGHPFQSLNASERSIYM